MKHIIQDGFVLLNVRSEGQSQFSVDVMWVDRYTPDTVQAEIGLVTVPEEMRRQPTSCFTLNGLIFIKEAK